MYGLVSTKGVEEVSHEAMREDGRRPASAAGLPSSSAQMARRVSPIGGPPGPGRRNGVLKGLNPRGLCRSMQGWLTPNCHETGYWPSPNGCRQPRACSDGCSVVGGCELRLGRGLRPIERDASLAARVLRISNSPFFGSAIPSTCLEEAVGCIGFNEIYRIVA